MRDSSLMESSTNNSILSISLASSSSVLMRDSILSISLASSMLVRDSSLMVSGLNGVISISLALKGSGGAGLAGSKRAEVVAVSIRSRELNRSHSLLRGKRLEGGASQSLFNSSINGRLERHHDVGDDLLLIQVGWHSILHHGSTGCQPSKSKHT